VRQRVGYYWASLTPDLAFVRPHELRSQKSLSQAEIFVARASSFEYLLDDSDSFTPNR